MKKCSKCGEEKPRVEFYRRKGATDGLMSSCKSCKTASFRAWVDKNRSKWNEYVKAEYAASNRRKVKLERSAKKIAAAAKFREDNAERLRQERLRRHEDRPEVRAYRKAYRSSQEYRDRANQRRRERQSSDPGFRLNRRMSSAISRTLKTGKGGRCWMSFVPYDLDQLRIHIERQFLPGMDWGNMGKWHIDHIVPLASFTFESEQDPDFQAAWAITNLRPLWAKDNLKKHSKVLTLL